MRLARGAGRGALAALLALFAVFAGQASALPTPETFTLRNGMQVVVITDRRAPVVTHMVWYRVGSADEPPGKSGVAHYLEHLMFKGTRSIGPGEFSKTIARNGGDDNAFTSYDFTAYFQRISRDRLELVMRMEADRMRNLRFDDEAARTERDVIIEERRQRTDNEPSARLFERMRAMLYPHHPYGTPIIGWLHEMQGLSREDALAFYRRHYAPENAVLVVAGDIDVAELRPMAERIYGRIRPNRAPLPQRVWLEDPPQDAAKRVTLSDPKVRQPSLSRLYKAVSYPTAEGREAHALDLAVEILGGSQTSRLYRTLVEEKRVAVAAGAGAGLDGRGGGFVSVSATPVEGVSLETLERELDAVIDRYLQEGPTDAELARAKSRLVASAIYARDSQEGLANLFGAAIVQGWGVEGVLSWADEVSAVTKEEAMAALRAALRETNSVTGLLLPQPDAAAEAAE